MGASLVVYRSADLIRKEFPGRSLKRDDQTAEVCAADDGPDLPRSVAVAFEASIGNIATVGALRAEAVERLGRPIPEPLGRLLAGFAGEVVPLVELAELATQADRLAGQGSPLMMNFVAILRRCIEVCGEQQSPIMTT